MKAITRLIYGTQNVLKVDNIEKPVPKNDEVLVRIKATTVNRTDCGILLGKPFVIRFFTGLFKPKKPVTGTDFAGIIEEIGADVKSFKIGEKVFGFDDNGLSSMAQYMTISEKKALTTIPENTTFEEAAASIEGAHYAFNFINKVKLDSQHKVLVYGASGAIGSAAVQMLKYYGIYVTAVCNTKNVTTVKSLGVDKVVDYLKEDFTKDDQKYHFIFDAVGKSSFGTCKTLLLPGGVYISSELGRMAQNLFFALATPMKSLLMGKKKTKRVIFPVPSNIKRSLLAVRKMIEEGKYKALIDRSYPQEEAANAFKYVLTGQKTGNVILKIN